ncbi:TPR repeat-containing protein [Diaporthe helianthi]|uniref:TPR repeat-containing protein n=1 Tax=Diaporthe helianthi TaxID=158607 RepID=A0A2P5HMW4_DIAHE|nr:TPR repeat-containing protein [Diaporthe helianthi]
MAPPSLSDGLAAFNAFLQANVTGPVLTRDQIDLTAPYLDAPGFDLGIRSLDVDGVGVYPFIPHIDLFCLARLAIGNESSEANWAAAQTEAGHQRGVSLAWMKLRLHVWHYKLFIHPSLSSRSVFTKNTAMSEVPSLVEKIQEGLARVESELIGEACEGSDPKYSSEDKVRFLVEKANVCIMLGHDVRAREALNLAAELNGFVYALSGALGKRTRFQDKSTSQLVVLAKSSVEVSKQEGEEGEDGEEGEEGAPQALPLNDDTLLENIEFSKDAKEGKHGEKNPSATESSLPVQLQGIKADQQPQLSTLDQIILLTEATLKDAFSPSDTLTSEQILPFAVRVIYDKSTNWQVYTQALLVRSRIEMHHSRTVERGVLQMQVVIDQVLVDTAEKSTPSHGGDPTGRDEDRNVPAISIDAGPEVNLDRTSAAPVDKKPRSFFPTSEPTVSASADVRLQYIHALSSPPRWHLESELAYAWTGVGSLMSALEIFKRLRLWAEVALCLASSATLHEGDGSGRGSGGEEKARAIIRWRLFHRKGRALAPPGEEIDEDTDITLLKAGDFTGPERTPPQPDAPRLFCILGDMEPDSAVAHYERAWELSKKRYARAQKSLGEHYLALKNWHRAREAYNLAVSVNRIAPELWNRLGDINLRLGLFDDAAESYTRAIGASNDMSGGEDARTWSNLGSTLYSMYLEAVRESQRAKEADNESEAPTKGHQRAGEEEDGEADDEPQSLTKQSPSDPAMLLMQSMKAYKRGASIAGDNWRIWDNVITLATRMRPMAFFEIIQAVRSIIRLRQTEAALDDGILRLLLTDGVLAVEKKNDAIPDAVYEPPRGSVERNINEMMESEIVPLITSRSELWELVSRLRVWRRDYQGAIDASEKAWRAAVGGATSGASSMGGGLTADSAMSRPEQGGGGGVRGNWLEDKEAWQVVVQRTDELVAVLENYGTQVEDVGDKWKGKARAAIRSVMGKGKDYWEGSEGWQALKGLLDGLRT